MPQKYKRGILVSLSLSSRRSFHPMTNWDDRDDMDGVEIAVRAASDRRVYATNTTSLVVR